MKTNGGALAFDTELLFEISQEVAEINVEEVTRFGDHDVTFGSE